MTHALIIDDDRSNLGVLEQLLSMQGITSTAFQYPTQVESYLATNNDIDIILLDLEMPDIDGYQMMEILQTYPQLEGVPIVACSVHVGEINNARGLGFHSFMSKPLNVDTFGDQLTRILNGQSIWKAY